MAKPISSIHAETAPTPVSALLHAATMVTAGVYLLIRLSPIFSMTPITLTLISIIGALTAFFAASSGLVQNDVKRVIAYSTSSQLGFIRLTYYYFHHHQIQKTIKIFYLLLI
jgi:NADH:ubiquinone oxidoreductase subunit 5 (subunit L)/multisubunit Na+/H+ antiporter MnhA subunit